MRASVRKIAEITGFSPATVSRALNRKEGVNRQTRETIFTTAREIGYETEGKPLFSAESYAFNRIRFVKYRKTGLFLDSNQFHVSVMEGVERQARLLGLDTLYSILDTGDPFFDRQLNEILSDTESGVILLATEMLEEDYRHFLPLKSRVLTLGSASNKYAFNSIMVDNLEGAETVVGYLYEKGHRKLGYLKGKNRIQPFKKRSIGLFHAAETHGVDIDPSHVVEVGIGPAAAYEDMKIYLSTKRDLPTAFIADNDEIAIGAMRAIAEAGYRIPEDISVIGFDNEAIGEVTTPPLTSVSVDKLTIGQTAVMLLMSYAHTAPGAPLKVMIRTELVERESVREIPLK